MANSTVRTIRLRWHGRCSVCGDDLPAGERARWDGRSRTATCLTCAAWAPYLVDDPTSKLTSSGQPLARVPAEIGVAGASALREHSRRREARERRAREGAGIVGVWWVRLKGDPLSTHWWKQGGEGEVKIARRLADLLDGSGVHLLHDRRMPGRGRANIDHIAVGPGGITVIDAKTVKGKVRVESTGGLFGPRRRQLRVKGRDRSRLVYGVRAQAEAVRAVLAQRDIAIDVRCALCFASVEGLPWFRRLEVEGVPIDGARRVAKLAARPGTHTEQEVDRIVRLLAAVLPAA
ncbi:MAG: nuclease-related domain-containing protein [Solirubrobacteraceae bacterium]